MVMPAARLNLHDHDDLRVEGSDLSGSEICRRLERQLVDARFERSVIGQEPADAAIGICLGCGQVSPMFAVPDLE